MNIDRDSLDQALETLGEVLQARGLAYEIVVVGGSGLLLLGFVTRPTKDLDALALVDDGDYVSADQGMNSKHAADLRALQPTAEELLAAGRWSRTHDPSEGYRLELVETLAAFGAPDANDHV